MYNPKDIRIEEYNYPLPEDRIAKYPLKERDASKLLHLDDEAISEYKFRDVPALLPPDSLLIFNETKVVQARLLFRKKTGAQIEVFILEPYNTDIQTAFQSTKPLQWKCFVGNAKKWKSGPVYLKIDDGLHLQAKKIRQEENTFILEISWNGDQTFSKVLHKAGEIPLPPYLKRKAKPSDRKRYQTVFAKNDGSVAAPTAGLHFTPDIIEQLHNRGVLSEKVTLHIGAGTFKPVVEEKIGKHDMHNEKIVISLHTIKRLHEQSEKLFTPVGTTSVRTMESVYWYAVKIAEEGADAEFNIEQWFPYKAHNIQLTRKKALETVIDALISKNREQLTGETRLMIVPGYRYMMADAMFTNFHQPKSTLLLLVSAFIGEQWKEAYRYALNNDFRFLSYGDSCYFKKEKTN